MIKKLFLCAALVGAVGLTSCVDDVESATVTALRNANAEKLKAVADAAKANAEAAIISANAQQKAAETAAAAQKANEEYINAQAAYLNAQAALEQAKADAQKAQTEIDKQKAEVAIQQALADVEKTKAEVEWTKTQVDQAKAELQALIVQYEKDIANYKYLIEKYKNDLTDEINTAQGKQYAQLKNLVEKYQGALDKLDEYKDELTKQIFLKAKVEANLADWDVLLYSQIDGMREKQNEFTEDIKEFQAQIAIYQTADFQNAAPNVVALKQEKAKLTTQKRDASLKYQELASKLADASTDVDKSDYMKAVEALTASSTPSIYPANKTLMQVQTSSPSAPAAMIGQYCIQVTTTDNNGNPVYTYTPVFNGGTASSKTISVTVSSSGDFTFGESLSSASGALNYPYTTYSEDYYAILNDGAGVKALKTIMADNVTELTEKAKKASKLYGDMTSQQKAVADASEEYEAAQEANAAITDQDDPKKEDAEKEELAKAKALWKAMLAAEKTIVDSDLILTGQNGRPINDLSGDAPEDDDDVAWTAAIANITNVLPQLERRIDAAVSKTNSDNIQAEKDLATAKENKTLVDESLDTMTADASEFGNAVDKADDLNKQATEAKATVGAIQEQIKVVDAKIYAYNNLDNLTSSTTTSIKYPVVKYTNGGDLEFDYKTDNFTLNNVDNINKVVGYFNDAIEAATKENEKLDAEIAAVQERIDAGYTDKDEAEKNYKESLAKIDDEIKKLGLQIEAQQAIVDAAQAALEAAIKAITPDAPAEK